MKVLLIVFYVLQWCLVLHNAAKTKISTTISYRDFMLAMHKKFNKIEYNPNYGYEPYWADGEWVLSTPKPDPFATTTKIPLICGDECNYLWRRIKHVCGRKSDYTDPHGCWSLFGGLFCKGKPGDDLNYGFRTFDTYCQFLDAQCRDLFHHPSRWVLVHPGKCKRVDDYFKPMWEAWYPDDRKKKYLSAYESRYYTGKTRKPFGS